MLVRNNNLHIRRFEFKYLLKENDLDKLRGSLKNFVIEDPHTDEKMSFYQVNSLYFDDRNFSSYYEKAAGLKARKKYRIRTYGDILKRTDKVFLEIKKRDETIIFKDRSYINKDKIKNVLENGAYELLDEGEPSVNQQFISAFLTRRLKPVVLISYKREAYFDKRNLSFRITLDQKINAKKSDEINFDTKDSSEIFPGLAVIEVKFNRIMPSWFGILIKSHNLIKISFSKYCHGLETCGIVGKTDLPQVSPLWI